MLGVVKANALSVGLSTRRFSFRFPNGGTQRHYSCYSAYKTTAQYYVHYLAEFHLCSYY